MAQTIASQPGYGTTQALVRRRPWGLAHYLAILGVCSLTFGAWTVLPWLLEGPEPVLADRATAGPTWIAARIYESLALTVAFVMAIVVVRGCVRNGGMTFDAKFCLGWCLMYWIDPALNMVGPIWMYSAHWVNVAAWCGHMPLVLNADCGRLPEPWLFMWPLYTFGFLAFIIGVNALMRWVVRRWPTMSKAKLVLIACVAGAAVDVALELPMYKLYLWGFPGAPDELALMGVTNRYPLAQIFLGILVFTPCALLRYYKSDKGLSATERGLEHLPSWGQALVSSLATYGFVTILGVAVTLGSVLVGMYADPYPRMPAHLVNKMCDSPGLEQTAYGTCPGGNAGDAGWELPLNKLRR